MASMAVGPAKEGVRGEQFLSGHFSNPSCPPVLEPCYDAVPFPHVGTQPPDCMHTHTHTHTRGGHECQAHVLQAGHTSSRLFMCSATTPSTLTQRMPHSRRSLMACSLHVRTNLRI